MTETTTAPQDPGDEGFTVRRFVRGATFLNTKGKLMLELFPIDGDTQLGKPWFFDIKGIEHLVTGGCYDVLAQDNGRVRFAKAVFQGMWHEPAKVDEWRAATMGAKRAHESAKREEKLRKSLDFDTLEPIKRAYQRATQPERIHIELAVLAYLRRGR